MKKVSYLLLIFSLGAILQTSAQQNSGFENWTNHQLYDEPDGFFTTNFQTYLEFGQAGVTMVSGQSGNALRMENVVTSTDTIASVAILGNPATGTFGGGYPYTGTPDSIKGVFRWEMATGDTASLFLIFTVGGFPLSIPQPIEITGQQSSWTELAMELPQFPTPPDTVVMFASSGNLNGDPLPGSWIEIDEIVFTGTNQQIPNNEFENWTDIEYDDPDGWESANFFTATMKGSPSAVQTSDAYMGSSALELTTVELSFFGAEPDTIGIIGNGSLLEALDNAGEPYTQKPDQLSFYYKYAPQGMDTARAYVGFSRWTGNMREYIVDTVATLSTQSSYTKQDLPIEWPTGAPSPDTVTVFFLSSGFEEFNDFNGNPGSTLHVDEVSLNFNTGVSHSMDFFPEKPYPNPAMDHIYLPAFNNVEGQIVTIYDISGKGITSFSNPKSKNGYMRINTDQLAEGIYIYTIDNGEDRKTGKFSIMK